MSREIMPEQAIYSLKTRDITVKRADEIAELISDLEFKTNNWDKVCAAEVDRLKSKEFSKEVEMRETIKRLEQIIRKCPRQSGEACEDMCVIYSLCSDYWDRQAENE